MKLAFRHLPALAVILLLPAIARADEASHRAAAEQLLMAMDMEKMMAQSVEQLLSVQFKQNPGLQQFEPQMRTFLGKYMSWGAVKDDLINAYTTEFTEPELREMTKFYQTDVGKKWVQKMPALIAKSAELSQKRMQEHMPELQQEIAKSMGQTPPGAPPGGSPPAKQGASPAKKGP